MTTNKDRRPGPEPERLKLDEDDWRKAVKKVLRKKKPPEGFPPEGRDDVADEPMDDDT